MHTLRASRALSATARFRYTQHCLSSGPQSDISPAQGSLRTRSTNKSPSPIGSSRVVRLTAVVVDVVTLSYTSGAVHAHIHTFSCTDGVYVRFTSDRSKSPFPIGYSGIVGLTVVVLDVPSPLHTSVAVHAQIRTCSSADGVSANGKVRTSRSWP